MEDGRYELPEQLILARQANLLRSFFKLVAILTGTALVLIALLPGFATSEEVLEPFVRNVIVLLTLGGLYAIVQKGHVLLAIHSTIVSCAVIACYTIFMESPDNMQMLALIVFPTCIAGLLPSRRQFWIVYAVNLALIGLTVWMIITYRGVELEYRSVVTLAMLHTLLALLIDTLSSSYRDTIRTTFNHLKAIDSAEHKLQQLDADLDVAVSQRMVAESARKQLAQTGRMALEVAGAGSLSINLGSSSVAVFDDFFAHAGFTPPDSIQTLYDCIHDSDKTRFELLLQQSSASRDRMEGDFRINAPRPVYWMFMLESGHRPDGESTLEGIVVDVTARVQEQQRKAAEESKTQESQRLASLGMLSGAIAHDFNNLLHVIMLNADLARQGLNPDSKSATSLDRLMTTVDRAAELCSELLAYSGRGQFTIEPFDAKKLVTDMRNLLDISTPKGVEIQIRTDDSDPVIHADATQIRQVVMNLITNAGEATSNTGAIELSISTCRCDADFFNSRNFIEEVKPGDFACITIEDHGSGMDTATMRHMFDPFFSTKETGHGLGLSAVLGIIRGHQGTIEVTSSLGEGTVVTMLLPITPEKPVAQDDRNVTAARATGKGIILFADDEEEIRKLGSYVLEEIGYTVLEAKDGQEAVDAYRAQHEDLHLVILDLMMPTKTGLEAYLEICEIDSSVPVVFSSGFNENEALQQLPPRTRSGFLKKPYLAEDLRQFVNGLIGPDKARGTG